MKDLFFDVVIVGSGPSGISSAINLLKNNINCCLVDKKAFPRNKLCGGLLTKKTIDLISSISSDINLNSAYSNKTNNINIFYRDKIITNINTKEYFYLTDRLYFDNLLLNYYKSMNGKYIERFNVIGIDKCKKEIISYEGNKIKYKYLIAADGANSIIRKIIVPNYKINGFCLEVDIDNKNNHKDIQIHFGLLRKGYGWVFPKKDHLTIGIGSFFDKKIDYKSILYDYFKLLNINSKDVIIKGHFIPLGKYLSNPIDTINDIFFVGDAAGLVDPFTGEGLYFSLLSGIFSSNTIIENIKKNDIKKYDSFVIEMKKIHKIIKSGNNIQRMFYSKAFHKKILNLINKHNNFSRYFTDNIISNYRFNYNNFLKIIKDYYKNKKYDL